MGNQISAKTGVGCQTYASIIAVSIFVESGATLHVRSNDPHLADFDYAIYESGHSTRLEN